MKKKILSVLLASAMVLGLMTGCGSKEEAPADALPLLNGNYISYPYGRITESNIEKYLSGNE